MAEALPVIDRERKGLAAAEALLGKRQDDLTQRVVGSSGARNTELAPMEKDLTASMAQPIPERRQVDLPQAPTKPIIDAKDYQQFSYGLLAMAMLGGAASNNWLTVSKTLNGAMEGYTQGNVQAAQERYADYERAFKGAVAEEKKANQEFEDILKKRDISINEMFTRYKVAAAKYDRQDLRFAAEQKNLDTMWSRLEQRRGALLKLEEQHEKNGANIPSGGLSDRYRSDAQYKKNVDYWAGLVQKGVQLPARFAQSGAGKQMMPDILNVVPTLGSGSPNEMIANKLSQREMTAEAQKLGTQAASVAIANKELDRFIPAAEKASDAVPRTAWKPLNQLLQAGENTWSPAQKQFVLANRAVQTGYAQLIQRGAPTVHSSQEAESMLATADSPEVYKAALRQLTVEGQVAEQGLNDARDDLLRRARDMGTTVGPSGNAIQPGHVEDGYRFKGGDPSKKENWEQAP